MGMDLNTNSHLLFYPLVCFNLNPVPLFETQSSMPCLAAVLHLSPVTIRNIVSDHKNVFNSIYQTWHFTPYIPPSAASMAEKGGRIVRKLWSRLDRLGRGFGVRWRIEIRKEGLRRRWVCIFMVQSDSILFVNNRKKGSFKRAGAICCPNKSRSVK